MIKILSFIFIVSVVIFAVFGFLILIEYLRYFKRRIALQLRDKLNNEVSDND